MAYIYGLEKEKFSMKLAVYHCDICGTKTENISYLEVTFDYANTDPCWGEQTDERELLSDGNMETLEKLSNPNILICWDCNKEGTPFDDAFEHVRKIRTKILLQIRNEK